MLYRVAVLGAALLASRGADALVLSAPAMPSVVRKHGSSVLVQATSAPVAEDCGCEDADGSIMLNGVSVSGSTLRDMELATASGTRARASSLIGEDGKAVVVFLRHLG